jgi:hypothetical protein
MTERYSHLETALSYDFSRPSSSSDALDGSLENFEGQNELNHRVSTADELKDSKKAANYERNWEQLKKSYSN